MYIIFNIFSSIFPLIYLKKYLHLYQLKDYNNLRYFKYFFKKCCFYIVFCVILICFSVIFKNFWINLIFYFFNILFIILINLKIINSNKTPLKFTNKIKRLFSISVIIYILLSFIKYSYFIYQLVLVMCPIISSLLNFYDRIKNKIYIIKAQEKIKKYNPKIIAITGSNGKTSVKNILLKILSKKYSVIACPNSYNTPLGISKFLNESLTKKYDFVILEYGARNKFDIKKLCKLYGANYGIITTIAPQHLESFKTLENIYNAKNELSKFLQNKMCIYNLDNLYSYRMWKNKTGEKFGISIKNKIGVFASNIKLTNHKTSFDINLDNIIFNVTTRLLGNHNVQNIMLACALCVYLQVPIKDIEMAIGELDFTPHRLELIKLHLNILDDSYNCSLESGKCAIEVLNQFGGKKMIVTPGIIEGGKSQPLLNEILMTFCKDLDYVVIVGLTNKESLLSGLNKITFNKKNILFANTLNDAKEYFKLLNSSDCLLLLNDLPDDYN